MAAGIAAHQEHVRMLMLKHQIRLTVGLIKQSVNKDNDDPSASFHKNILLSPHLVLSTLTSLMPGTEKDTRVKLARTLMHHRINELTVHDYVYNYCRNNKSMLKRNRMSMRVDTAQYRNPSPFELTEEEELKLVIRYDKLLEKYQCTGKELPLMNGEEPCLETLATINKDIPESVDDPILSEEDYVTLVNDQIDTLLISSVHFKALWSKEFKLRHGEFHKANGESVMTMFLYKKKSFLFYEDYQSKSSAIKINFTHDGSASMVLVLPEENVSMRRILHKLLDYDALKRILKNLTTRFEVRLTLPKFALKAKVNMTKPLERIGDLLPNLNRDYEAISSIDEKVVLVQRLTIEVNEKGVESKPGLISKLITHEEAEFKADRPFLFLIVTNGFHKQILFAGVCNDPTQECV